MSYLPGTTGYQWQILEDSLAIEAGEAAGSVTVFQYSPDLTNSIYRYDAPHVDLQPWFTSALEYDFSQVGNTIIFKPVVGGGSAANAALQAHSMHFNIRAVGTGNSADTRLNDITIGIASWPIHNRNWVNNLTHSDNPEYNFRMEDAAGNWFQIENAKIRHSTMNHFAFVPAGGYDQASPGWRFGYSQGAAPPPSASSQVSAAIDGTSFAASISTSANADVDAVAVDANDAVSSTAAVAALGRFTGDASAFAAASFTKTKKRAVFKNLLKQVVDKLTDGKFVLSNKAEFLNFITATDSSTEWQSKIRDNIEVVKAGSAGVSVDMAVTSVYSPFSDGESITVTDSTTSVVFVMGQSGSTFTLTVDGAVPANFTGTADTEGAVFTYADTANSMEYVFLWGSGTMGGGGTSGADGDPYVTTLSGTTYKMDDFTGFSRMLQGTLDDKLFTINAETNLLTKAELTDLVIMRNKQNNAPLPQHLQFDTFPAYFTKLYVAWGDDHMTIDLKNHAIVESTINTEYEILNCEEKEYQWSNKRSGAEKMLLPFGDVILIIKNFKNKDIRNGFTLLGSHHITNRNGALEHTIYTKDMKLKKLTTLTPLKQLTDRRPKRMSKETFYEKSGEERIVELPIF